MDAPDGTPLAPLADYIGERGWQLVPTQWHRVGDRAANTPLRGFTGAAPFLTPNQVRDRVHELVLHREGGPDCTGRNAKPAIRPPLNVTLLDVDHGYAGKHGGDTLVALEMELGPLAGSYSVTARGPWQPSRRVAYRHPADLVILDRAFTDHGGHIETVRTGHRYSWAPPAIHTRKGAVVGPVQWYDRNHNVVDMPHVDQLAELPASWVEFLRARSVRAGGVTVQAGAAPGQARAITEDHADAIVRKMADRLHATPPSGGEFRSTVFGLACVVARREVARDGTRQAVMDQVAQLFAEHPMALRMDGDDVQWAEDGIERGWAEPWRFEHDNLVPIRMGTEREFAQAATDDEVDYFLATYTRYGRPDRLGRRTAWMNADPPGRMSWHARRMVEDVLAGHYPAARALDVLADVYRRRGGADPDGARRLIAVALGATLNQKVSA